MGRPARAANYQPLPPPALVAPPTRLFHCSGCGKQVLTPVDKEGLPVGRVQCNDCRNESVARYCRLPGLIVAEGNLPTGLPALVRTCNNYDAAGRCIWIPQCLVLFGERCRLFETTVCPPLVGHPEAWVTVAGYIRAHRLQGLARDPEHSRSGIRLCPVCKTKPVLKHHQRCELCASKIHRLKVRNAVRRSRKGKNHARTEA